MSRATFLLCLLVLINACDDEAGTDSNLDAGVCVAAAPTPSSFPDPACPIIKPPSDALDEALALVGLDRCSLGFSAANWAIFDPSLTHDPFRLPWYDAVHDHAVRAPSFARDLVTRLDQAADSSPRLAGRLAVLAESFEATAIGCPPRLPIDAQQPLVVAVAKVMIDSGGQPDLVALRADAADVPLDLQRALAAIILAAGEANAHFDRVIAPLSTVERETLAYASRLPLATALDLPNLADPDVVKLLSTGIDLKALTAGAVQLAARLDANDLAPFAHRKGFSFDQMTPIGRILLRDDADDTYADDGKPVLVQLDTGGNDRYLGPTGAVDAVTDTSGIHHVSVAIDLAGADDYGYTAVADPADTGRLPSDAAGRYRPSRPLTEDNGPVTLSDTPRQGAARLGYGFLLDLGSEGDHYRSLRMSQGFGAVGVGILYDAGGDDVYEGEAAVQGAATFGMGLLFDDSGNDTYNAYAFTQGFGFVRGVGLLYDSSGADRYLANTGDVATGGDPIYFSPQLPGIANGSFAQGAGFGRNGGGGVYMSGGLGVLRDRRGDDVYRAAVFAQATGYWFGTGILADQAGNDTYDGLWYVQGSAAHFALAVFLDDAGDDKYNLGLTPAATSIGVGHDFSVSWHIDSGGNDNYRAPGLSLGGGNANGLGVMLNLGGDDTYAAAGEPTLGVGNLSSEVDTSAVRRGVPTTGVFIDIGGHDQYLVTSNVTRGDNVSWINNRESPDAGVTSEHGVGVDRAAGSVALP